MGPKEEELRVQERIQEEPLTPRQQAIVGIIGVTVLLALPMILEWASGGRPGRF